MIEIAVNVGSPGLANRIKTYVSILTTFKQALTVKEADAYIFDSIDLATDEQVRAYPCLLYTSPSPRDQRGSRMPSSA